MLIYRVETITCIGAFAAGLADEHDKYVSLAAGEEFVYFMPDPFSEPKCSPVHQWAANAGYDQMRFGFASLDSLKAAFTSPKGRAAMDKKGGQCSVYEVDPAYVLIGTAQVVFNREQAKLVEVLDCGSLTPRY